MAGCPALYKLTGGYAPDTPRSSPAITQACCCSARRTSAAARLARRRASTSNSVRAARYRKRQSEERLAFGGCIRRRRLRGVRRGWTAVPPGHPEQEMVQARSRRRGSAYQPALRAAHVRHHIASPRRAVVGRRSVARSCRCECDGEDLCALPAGRTKGRVGDIGSSCDKHCDTSRNSGGIEIGSDPAALVIRAHFRGARPKRFELPTF